MNPVFGAIIAVIFLVIIMNFVALYIRIKKNPSVYGRRGKRAPEEQVAAEHRDREVLRRLDAEQDRYIRHIELRGKTWELYEEVRKRHEGEDIGETSPEK